MSEIISSEVSNDEALAAVRTIIKYIGEDPTRDGLIDTPKRVLKAWREMTEGYGQDPEKILSTTFDVAFDEMVILRRIPFTSFCEHHMLPFEGTADIAYLPTDRIVGLSKLARIVDVYAKRLQVQERLTQQIREAIDEYLKPIGSGVVIRASHSCMCYRGIKKRGEMITSSLSGVMRTEQIVRAEFLALVKE
jgi:GTP cyclohydrolase I